MALHTWSSKIYVHKSSFFIILVTLTGVLGQYSDGCASNQFSCRIGGYCIQKNQWCDQVRDCSNGYDEIFCNRIRNETHPVVCPSELLPCESQGCVPWKARCDGISSCIDGYDERDCQTRPDRQLRRVPQAASPTVLEIPDVTDYDHSYEDDTAYYQDEEKNAKDWVLKAREDYAWGDDTERAIVALSFSEHGKFGSDSGEKDVMLMIKSLHLRISLALSRNWDKTSLSSRAHFISALTATCGNPRDFYGFNLVDDLRGKADQLLRSTRQVFATPIVYLTLCLTDRLGPNDIEIIKLAAARLTTNSKNDLQALYLLTIVCMDKLENVEKNSKLLGRIKRYLVKNLLKSDAENIYELALVTQALNAARVNPETWDRQEKMKSILKHQNKEGSFRDMLATYYVMPLLSRKSLISVGDHCEKKDSVSMESVRSLKERIYVNYTLNFGPQNVSQTMFLSMLKNSTVYDVMRLAQKRNHNFRFSLDDKKISAPLVYSIGGIPNDAEKGLFWIVEVSRWYRFHEVSDIKAYNLQNEDAIIFSMKVQQY